MCMAVGTRRLEDWERLTWSLGWTGCLEPSLPPEHLDGPVGDHLVGVHVCLGAGARLPHDEGEMVVELTVDDLLGGGGDGLAEFCIEGPLRHVGEAGGRA
jgi:hypothetical protein